MNDFDFASQDCFVAIPRITNLMKDRSSPPTPNSETMDDRSSSLPQQIKVNTARRGRRPASFTSAKFSRKRAPVDDDSPTPSKSIPKNLQTSNVSKKVKFGIAYEPEKDNISFNSLDPEEYELVSILVPPTFSDANSDHCLFPLSKSQSKKINLDNYCVLLRLSYFTKQIETYEDVFDYGMSIKVNDVLIPLTQATEDDPNASLEGPADITRYLTADGSTIEKVKISYEGQAKPHVFSIQFVKKKKYELPYVTLRYVEPSTTFKTFMRNNEEDISISSQAFRKLYPLTDPISKQRMETPVRGQFCNHVECFDKTCFLRNNRRTVNWVCPICTKTIKEDHLVVDGLFLQILARTFSSCYSVEIDSFGGWSPVYRGKVFRAQQVDLDSDECEGEGEGEDEEEEIDQVRESPSPVDILPLDEDTHRNNPGDAKLKDFEDSVVSKPMHIQEERPVPKLSSYSRLEKQRSVDGDICKLSKIRDNPLQSTQIDLIERNVNLDDEECQVIKTSRNASDLVEGPNFDLSMINN